MTCPRCEIAAAERASHVTGLAYVLTAGGFRPMSPGADPFAGAVMADDDFSEENLLRAHSVYVMHRRQYTEPPAWAREGERVYNRLRRRAQRAQGRAVTAQPDILTSPAGAPMLVSVAGEGGEFVDSARQADDAELTA